jgi:hypothetical protein
MKATDSPLYTAVCTELPRQANRMNALNAALDVYRDNPVWYERLFKEFGDASFLVVALSETKKKMEEQP